MENPAVSVAPGRRSLCNSRIPRVPNPRKDVTDPPPPQSQRRVFGTTRNPNVPTKLPQPPPQPATKKPVVRIIRKAPIRNEHKVSQNEQANVKSRKQKQGKRIPQVSKDVTAIDSAEKGSSSPRTPTVHSSEADSETTPYYTGEICNKSRRDRLEMASYWLNQIKLAEDAGKDFVSVAFFRLAMESNAQPIESLRDELKQYLGRNGSLWSENQWIDVSSLYGLSR